MTVLDVFHVHLCNRDSGGTGTVNKIVQFFVDVCHPILVVDPLVAGFSISSFEHLKACQGPGLPHQSVTAKPFCALKAWAAERQRTMFPPCIETLRMSERSEQGKASAGSFAPATKLLSKTCWLPSHWLRRFDS